MKSLSLYITAVFVFLSLSGCKKDKLAFQDEDMKAGTFMELALCINGMEPGNELFYGSIWLLRAISKVNLLNIAEEFELCEAYVFNCMKQGKAVPFLQNVFTYYLDGKDGNMYPCHPDATCLVIGGKYDGSDRITYYN